jgi:hypothetical protein
LARIVEAAGAAAELGVEVGSGMAGFLERAPEGHFFIQW